MNWLAPKSAAYAWKGKWSTCLKQTAFSFFVRQGTLNLKSSITLIFILQLLILRTFKGIVLQRLIGSSSDFIDFEVFILKEGGAFKHRNMADY